MSEELKPCPFCPPDKSKPEAYSMKAHWIMCGGCGTASDNYPTTEDAIAAWNTRADGWQPIETAPKDGTEVMLGSEKIITIGAWDDWDSDEDYPLDDLERPKSRWENREGFEMFPTHWRPLPAPPEVTP